jgi:hypothetical protein
MSLARRKEIEELIAQKKQEMEEASRLVNLYNAKNTSYVSVMVWHPQSLHMVET